MFSNRKLLATSVVSALLATATVSTASAGGWIADTFIRPISPQAADAADGVNRQLGQPVDHFANGVAGAAVGYVAGPVAGGLVTGGLEARMNMQNAGNGGGFQNAGPFPTQPAMGNVCYTQVGAYPGPFNPIGSGCSANTPWGMAGGVVGQ